MVSLERIRRALARPPALQLVPVEREPDFRVRVERPHFMPGIFESLEFEAGPVPPDGLNAFEQRQRLGTQWSEPLVSVDLVAVTQLLTRPIASALRARRERLAREHVERDLAAFCAAGTC